ncbi:hypothetical protein NDU88_005934 [Pleurodeles waltl]|uniref:Uncharacterized protein n=1 Tax=Pleurodeles waltl TaxID=8319 RepID=A0AAV7LQY7_PLEWA|nr:hypothetical protein NDU88_005934 [Pleurodeles waltl]
MRQRCRKSYCLGLIDLPHAACCVLFRHVEQYYRPVDLAGEVVLTTLGCLAQHPSGFGQGALLLKYRRTCMQVTRGCTVFYFFDRRATTVGKVYVAKRGDNLLAWRHQRDMGIKLDPNSTCQAMVVSNRDANLDILEEFPTVFSDELGCLNDFEHTIILKSNAIPSVHKVRKVPRLMLKLSGVSRGAYLADRDNVVLLDYISHDA